MKKRKLWNTKCVTWCEFSTFWLRKHKLTASYVHARFNLLFIIMVTRLPRILLYIIHFWNNTCHTTADREYVSGKQIALQPAHWLTNSYVKDTGSTDKNKTSIYCQRESARWLIDVINILKIQTMSYNDDLQAWLTFLTGGAAQNGLELHVCDIHWVSRIRQGGGVQRGCGEKT